MEWKRVSPGTYQATDPMGAPWRIEQASSRLWEIYRYSTLVADMGSLADCKIVAESEYLDLQDPERVARRTRRRAEIRAGRRA